jgi:hypothetical protein
VGQQSADEAVFTDGEFDGIAVLRRLPLEYSLGASGRPGTLLSQITVRMKDDGQAERDGITDLWP